MKKFVCLSFMLLISVLFVNAQNAIISGTVTDKADKSPIPGVNVIIKGTSIGVPTDENGKYSLAVKPGQYNLEFTFIGYETVLMTAVTVKAGENKKIDVALGVSAVTFGQDVIVVGDKPLVDIEESKTIQSVSGKTIEAAPVRQIQSIVSTQAGVSLTPSGLHIRGARSYETGFLIDGVSARDPLAGTGFGIDIGSNAIEDVEITTSGAGADVGDATSGVIQTKTKSGGDKFELSGMYKRDDFGFNSSSPAVWNQQVMELGMGGPIKWVNKKRPTAFRYFVSGRAFYTDNFTRNPPKQVVSSLFPNTTFSPFLDNRYSGTMKLTYDFNERQHLTFSFNKTIAINQDENMLRITGNDLPFIPGYQFLFSEQMDNANTYTHDGTLAILNWQHSTNKRFAYNVTFSRFFARLRGDANGRDWRPNTVDSEFDPNSINTPPIQVFNPGDSIVFVNPPSGFYNNNGIATLWHHHYIEEYTLRFSGNVYSKNTFNRLNFGAEFKFQEMLWIDIQRPWIGAPITLSDGSQTQSFRLGEYSEVWKVNPSRGGFWVSDKIKYKGLIAEIGGRLEYWMPGKYVDNAINNPDAQIRDEIRQDYLNSSINILGNRTKFRFLPKIAASFPVTDNQMLYFNYGHSTILPHPSFIYGGLNPFYTDRSTFSRLGNPNLNPEVSIAYEIGLKSQITNNDVLNISAYWRDNYDFVTTTSLLVADNTGRELPRSIRINSDYAKVRGVEASYLKRVSDWFLGQLNVTYMVATGQSSSASEALKEILATGNREDTREYNLPWASPWEIKTNTTWMTPKGKNLFGVKGLNNMSLYLEGTFRTGRRYTPYVFTGTEELTGRPIYIQNQNPDARFSKIGESQFWVDLNFRKWWEIKKVKLALTFEITNVFNNLNAAIINPVTGRAWSSGDPVPTEWRDPSYLDPRDSRSRGTPPNNPARFMPGRHYMLGLSFKF